MTAILCVQVTNKINYKLEATIGKTKCRKSEDTDIQACGMAKKVDFFLFFFLHLI